MKPIFVCALLAGNLFVPVSLPGAIHGPATGFVLDGGLHAIRPVNGIPGASLLGGPLAIPFAVQNAAIAPERDFALVTGVEEGPIFLVRGLREPAPAVMTLEGAMPGATLFSLSPSGASALLYAPSVARIQVVSGLPEKPVAAPPLDLSSLPGGIALMALNDSGSRILAGVHDGGDYAVYGIFPAGGDSVPKLLGRTHDLSALTLLDDGADVVFADRSTSQVFLVHDVEGSAEFSVLAGEQDGVSAPVALQGVNTDLYVADAGSNSLTVIDMVNRGAPLSIALPGAPTRCERLDGGSTLVLNEVGGSPLLLLDLTQGRNVFFVPVDQAF